MGEPAQEEGTMSAKKSKGFTDDERAAMKERAQELKKAEGESAVLAKIDEMQGPDRAMAERLHEIVKASAPALSPKTWRSEEHTSELQSRQYLVCRLLLEKKKQTES